MYILFGFVPNIASKHYRDNYIILYAIQNFIFRSVHLVPVQEISAFRIFKKFLYLQRRFTALSNGILWHHTRGNRKYREHNFTLDFLLSNVHHMTIGWFIFGLKSDWQVPFNRRMASSSTIGAKMAPCVTAKTRLASFILIKQREYGFLIIQLRALLMRLHINRRKKHHGTSEPFRNSQDEQRK